MSDVDPKAGFQVTAIFLLSAKFLAEYVKGVRFALSAELTL